MLNFCDFIQVCVFTTNHHLNYRNFPTADQQQTIQEFYLAVICVLGGVKIWEFHQQKVF